MSRKSYIMESEHEVRRLELKTGHTEVETLARWAGLTSGTRVLDIGCAGGKTTAILKDIIGENGEIVGIDKSEERVRYARQRYGRKGICFECRDIYSSLIDLGTFDFVWVRFMLEYHKKKSADLVAAFTELLDDSGILFLGDLDHNGLNHFDIPPRVERAIYGCARALEENADFDPYAGRKLYSYLYDLRYRDIEVRVDAHHCIYGELDSVDEFNWLTKLAVAGKNSGFTFDEFSGGFDEFFEECKTFFNDPRRFTYTPIISCRGVKPAE